MDPGKGESLIAKAIRNSGHRAPGAPMTLDGAAFTSVAFLSRGLADENRLRILLCVSGGPRSVSAIVEEVGVSQPLVSHHLRELRRCLLVTVARDGPFVYYGLADPRVLEVIQTLARMAATLVAGRKSL